MILLCVWTINVYIDKAVHVLVNLLLFIVVVIIKKLSCSVLATLYTILASYYIIKFYLEFLTRFSLGSRFF